MWPATDLGRRPAREGTAVVAASMAASTAAEKEISKAPEVLLRELAPEGRSSGRRSNDESFGGESLGEETDPAADGGDEGHGLARRCGRGRGRRELQPSVGNVLGQLRAASVAAGRAASSDGSEGCRQHSPDGAGAETRVACCRGRRRRGWRAAGRRGNGGAGHGRQSAAAFAGRAGRHLCRGDRAQIRGREARPPFSAAGGRRSQSLHPTRVRGRSSARGGRRMRAGRWGRQCSRAAAVATRRGRRWRCHRVSAAGSEVPAP